MKSPLSYLPFASGFLVLVLSLAVGVLTVTSRNTNQQVSTKANEAVASLALSPASGDFVYASGTTYPVGIIVDSADRLVDGVDIIINFDPKKVRVVDNKVSTTTLFQEFPINTVDNVAGKIKFSALTFNPKVATGIVGTFRFQALTRGEADFTFDFTPGSTVDSNIADRATAKDILGKVENGKYLFK